MGWNMTGTKLKFPVIVAAGPQDSHSPRTHLSELRCHSYITVRDQGQAWSPVRLDAEICSKISSTHSFFFFFPSSLIALRQELDLTSLCGWSPRCGQGQSLDANLPLCLPHSTPGTCPHAPSFFFKFRVNIKLIMVMESLIYEMYLMYYLMHFEDILKDKIH